MTHVRPIARDAFPTDGRPVVTARRASTDAGVAACTPVTHSYAALAFYTGGRARVELHGEWNLREGDILLVPAGQPHRMLERQAFESWALAFCVPCLSRDDSASLLEPFERVRDGAAAVIHVPSPRHQYLECLFRELDEVGSKLRDPTDRLDAVQRSLLTLILAEVERASSFGSRSGSGGGGVVVDALRFIERHCLGRLTLNDVAAAVGRSPTYVTTALTQATARSAGQWIVSGRMAEARRLLLHSNEMIDVIAERVGYADATHFIRMFRREHGHARRMASSSNAPAGPLGGARHTTPFDTSSVVSSTLIIAAA